MEEGSLRCDANVSLRPAGSEELGTKTELKNMNSFRFLERGIEAEIERQARAARRRRAGSSRRRSTSTRAPASLTPLRSKEYAHDYRYFPEPDLVPLAPTEEMIAEAREALPELPGRSAASATSSELGLSEKLATQLAFDAELGAYFEAALAAADGVAAGDDRQLGHRRARRAPARGGRRGRRAAASKVEPEALAALAGMVEAKEVSTGAGAPGAGGAGRRGRRPGRDRRARGARPDRGRRGELEAIVERAIEADPEAAERVRGGNMKAIGPLVGYVMRETKGRADGGEVTRLIHEKLGIRRGLSEALVRSGTL